MESNYLMGTVTNTMDNFNKLPVQRLLDNASRGEMYVLRLLCEHPEGMLPGKISAEMGVTTARVSAALHTLELKGLIHRVSCAEDRRRTLVTVTPEGVEYSERKQVKLQEHVEKVFSQLGEPDAKELLRIMNKLMDISAHTSL